MKKSFRFLFLAMVVAIISGQPLHAADWHIIHSPLARVEYKPGREATADSLLRIADSVLPYLCERAGLPVSNLRKHPVRIILQDGVDVSNGFAIGNAVTIYSMSSMFVPNWSGTQPWYQMVLTHELAHTVTFRKLERKLNILGAAATFSPPRWFYEGIAQYYAERWNTYRGELYVRNALLSGDLDYSALDNLNDGRLLYAGAHAFVRYLAATYGDSSLIKLMAYKKDGWYYSFEKAFKAVYEQSPAEIFKDFHRQMVLFYGATLAAKAEHSWTTALPDGAYRDYQILQLNAADSLWLLVSRLDKAHQYRTVYTARLTKGKFIQQQIISNQIATEVFLSGDHALMAFGRYHVGRKDNLPTVSLDWYVYNFVDGHVNRIASKINARQAAFDSRNRLWLAEVQDDSTCFRKYDGQVWKTVYKTAMPAGSFLVHRDSTLIASLQTVDGQRDLFKINAAGFAHLTRDATDDRNPVLLNDSLLLFNRYRDNNPGLARLNLLSGRDNTILQDRYAYFVQTGDPYNQSAVIYRWQAGRKLKFFRAVGLDTMRLETNEHRANLESRLTNWQNSASLPKIKSKLQMKEDKPQKVSGYWPMEHLLSFALPTSDPDLGMGVYGTTLWLEPLQRQVLAAAFVLYQNYRDSFVSLQHSLAIGNGYLNSIYYHGPVIFGFEDGKYLNLYQDVLGFYWQRNDYLQGNPRLRLQSELSYRAYRADSYKNERPAFGLHGPGGTLGLHYLLPTRYYPALPARELQISASLFKSLQKEYDLLAVGIASRIGWRLFREDLGLLNRSQFYGFWGDAPPAQIFGIDRFYEFDVPRDFTYTKTIRGLRQDLAGTRLFWNALELTWLIDDHTSYKLLALPMDNLALTSFLDWARVESDKTRYVFSYGMELSFGSSFYRLGAGYALATDTVKKKTESAFLRIQLFLP